MKRTYNKLVRDLVPVIMARQGAIPQVRRIDGLEYLDALRRKAVEEAQELAEAKNGGQVLEELADLSQIVICCMESYGISRQELEQEVQRKLDEKGGFASKFFLEYAEEPEKNP